MFLKLKTDTLLRMDIQGEVILVYHSENRPVMDRNTLVSIIQEYSFFVQHVAAQFENHGPVHSADELIIVPCFHAL
jgi:DNA-directed RNA polymerase specialized sigma subunit